MIWHPPTLKDALKGLKIIRDNANSDKLSRRETKQLLALQELGRRIGRNDSRWDDDFEDLPDVDISASAKCPGLPGHMCNRIEIPEMMDDVSSIPDAIVGTSTYICHACREYLFGTNLIDRPSYMEYMGASQAMVDMIEQKLESDPLAIGKRSNSINPKQ